MKSELANDASDLAARAKRANQAHRQACKMAKGAIEQAKTCGDELIQIKGILGHGNFLPWLKENFEGSDRSARDYMRIAANWQFTANLDTATLAGALTSLKQNGRSPSRQPTFPPAAGRDEASDEDILKKYPLPPLVELDSGETEISTDDGKSPLDQVAVVQGKGDPEPQIDPLEISAEVRANLDRIEVVEGLGRVAMTDVIRYCYARLGMQAPKL